MWRCSFASPPNGFDDFTSLGFRGEFDDVDMFAFKFDDKLFTGLFLMVECFEFLGSELGICGGIIRAEKEEEP